MLAAFLVVGGGSVFAGVESHLGHHISTWDGIWWALGTMTTEGSNIEVTTTAGRVLAIVLMLTGIGVFSIITGAVAQHFLSTSPPNVATRLSEGEKAIMARLDELAARLDGMELSQASGGVSLHATVTGSVYADGRSGSVRNRTDTYDRSYR